MVPDKALIVLNQNLSIKQVSTIVRHEIMHEFLEHAMRREKWEDENGVKGSHQTANIAMDYEISNRAYTDADKETARSIFLNGQVLRGLVTEDQYPGWENKSFEEMYAELVKKEQEDKEQLKDLFDQLSKLDKKDLDELEKQLRDAAGEDNDAGEGEPMPGSSGKDDSESEDKDEGEGQTPAQKKASDLADEVDEIQDELGQNNSPEDNNSEKGGAGNSDSVFDTPQEQAAKLDRAERVAQIKKELSDIRNKESIDTENRNVKDKEKLNKRLADMRTSQRQPLNKFKLALNRFIQNQIATYNKESEEIFDPSYIDRGFLMPGEYEVTEKHTPLINVYWDVSGSFPEGSPKTQAAEKAINVLK